MANGKYLACCQLETRNLTIGPCLGCPLQDPLAAENVAKTNGHNRMASQLIQDINVIDTISHVTRERIPER
jgi:catalase